MNPGIRTVLSPTGLDFINRLPKVVQLMKYVIRVKAVGTLSAFMMLNPRP
jgi:hypothetical protein